VIGQTTMFAPDAGFPLRRRVQVERITTGAAREVLERFHYLHRARVGRQINYSVAIDGMIDGVITYAYPMMSAPLCGVPSDELLEFARLYLHRNIPHTASCAIGKSLKRLPCDWAILFPEAKKPILVVSWSDREYHIGTVYRAANFEWVKQTKGQPPGNSPNSKRGVRSPHGDYGHDKDCWVYWLDAKLRAVPRRWEVTG